MHKFAAIFTVLLSVCLVASQEGFFPSYIRPCHRSENNLNKCLADQIESALPKFAKGIPQLDVPSLDPVELKDINVNGIGLDIRFRETTMLGLSKSRVDSLLIDVEKESFSIDVSANLTVRGKYTIDGQFLVLPIKGAGNSKIRARNLQFNINSTFTTFKDENGEHYILRFPKYKYDMEKVTFYFENLFDGNQQLSNVTHIYANNNWRVLMKDLAPPVIQQIVETCLKSINKFFAMTTVQQIFPD